MTNGEKEAVSLLPRRVLIIGIDAAALDLVQPWVDQGLLPNIAHFFAEGAVGPLRSVPTQCSAAAWSSMVTGLNPGKHGLYWFTLDKPGSYEQAYINASYRDGRTLFRLLSDAGKSVGAINVPISYPAEEVNGFMIAGIDAPGVNAPGFTYPADLYTQLRREVGEYIIEPGIPSLFKMGRIDEAVQRLHKTIAYRYAYTRYLMQTRPWDFLMVVFRSTDPAQHFFWKYMRPDGFQVSKSDIQRYSGVILDVYRQIDGIIGELVALAGQDTAVFLASDHGATRCDNRASILPYWLEYLGLMQLSPTAADGWQGLRKALWNILGFAYKQLDKRTRRDLKLKLAHWFPRLRRRVEKQIMWYPGVGWSRTHAYCDGKRSDIWINVRGRQPEGIVEPGPEYEALRDEIIQALTQPRDPETGEPFVRAVYRREEIYKGKYVERSPDLIVDWNRSTTNIDRLILGDKRGVELRRLVEKQKLTQALISGWHDRDGLLAVSGSGILRGVRITGASLLDVAPTVLYLLGQPIPAEMDGQVLRDIIDPDLLQRCPVRILTEHKEPTRTEGGYTDEEARVVGERLRGLGYVD